MENEKNEMTIQAKAIKLFQYLKAMQSAQDNVVMLYSEQVWTKLVSELPDDSENIAFNYRNYEKDSDTEVGLTEVPYILKVHNPVLEVCPEPHERLRPWLNEDWNDFYVDEPELSNYIPIPGSNPVRYQYCESVVDLQIMYNKWLEKRNVWRERQLLLEKTRKLFSVFFWIRQSLLKEDDELELLIANGVFSYKNDDISVCHPVLLKRVTIDFDTQKNNLYIKDTDSNSNFYIEFFNTIEDIDKSTIQKFDAENSQKQYYPFDKNDAKQFFEQLIHSISPNGRYFPGTEVAQKDAEAEYTIAWEPMFILRKRPSGMEKMINKIIDKIDQTGEVPQHLINILQPGTNTVDTNYTENESTEEKLAAVGGEAIDILLPKEANQEQLDIAKTIARNDAVVVQGPPGTGKTHTIANLLGHFLSQGKRVLVTSHTNKALKVLKDKVVPALQPLCVSVTDDSRKDIESSIEAIASFSESPAKLERNIRECTSKRNDIIKQLNGTRKKLFQIRNQQCNTIMLNGEAISPIDAAKFLADNREKLADIIPGLVYECDALPVSNDELVKLYASNQSVSAEEEQQLACDLPKTEAIWPTADFAQMVEQYNDNKSIIDDLANTNHWQFIAGDASTNILDVEGVQIQFDASVQDQLQKAKLAVENIKNYAEWELCIIADGTNSLRKANWQRLVEAIDAAYTQYSKYKRLGFGKEVTLSSLTEAKQHLQDYKQLKDTDGKIGLLQGLFNGSLKKAKQCALINNAEIASGKDAELVVEYITFKDLESTCKVAWKQLFSGKVTYDDIEQAYKYAKSIVKLLNWKNGTYASILYKIGSCGIAVEKLCPANELVTELDNLKASLSFSKITAPKLVEGMFAFMAMREAESKLDLYYQQMSRDVLLNSAACVEVAKAIKNKDVQAYNEASEELRLLISKYTLQKMRFATLKKINQYAPAWASAIEKREGIHGGFSVSENIAEAWKWKQLERIINDINNCDYNGLQKKAVALSKDYHKITASLAAAMAWRALQKRNEKNAEQQSILKDLGQLMQRIGKGTGRNADYYRRLVREQMGKCQDAVPVWIMPDRKVIETFDPSVMKEFFDIIIVDEASQCDLTALAVTYLGKKLIIVGDDKQVSPLAVGKNEAPIKEKADLYISSWLTHKKAIGLKTSLYDIASSSYKSRMLLEHFRCVPEIIGYSNWLSYDNKIKPLREASSSNLLPAVVNYRVDGHRDGKKKVNEVEAKTIVALLKSCMEQPEYTGKTFGVISLLGSDQANYIQMELFKAISNKEYEERQIICGDSANFQGDERDVVFLSMVDSKEGEGVLRLTASDNDTYKKRYNVAASRAKDQLWVVNSLDEENSLQADDLRRGLLSYAKNPQNYKQTMLNIEKNSESPFEEAVAKALVSRGFHIVQQWEVGAYRIDMVAVYKNSKIAIECDGERYHSGEEKIFEDMQRQTILERLGWKFIRIRGSEYFADPENTINRVCELLLNYGIKYEDNFTATPVDRNTELLERVKQRAAEIIRGENIQKAETPVQPPKSSVKSKLTGTTPKSTGTTPKPSGAMPKPAGTTPKSTGTTPKPTVTMPKPTVTTPKPTGTTPKPTVTTPKPPVINQKIDSKIQLLIRLLESKNVKYKDNLSKGGAFWVIGGGEIAVVLREAGKIGFNFKCDEDKNRWLLINVKSNQRVGEKQSKKQNDAIISLLNECGVEYIDKRSEKGSLWIIGGDELKSVVAQAEKIGVKFYFKPEGGRLTKHRPSWWAK